MLIFASESDLTVKKLQLIFITVLAVSFSVSRAQQTVFEETQVLYFSEMAGGLILHTSGWGLNFYYAENITGFKRRVYEAELVGMKHEREIKTLSDFNNIRGYFYGKQNTLTILRTSMGIQNTFLPKQSLKGVAVSYDINYGISHGIAKPVYLSIAYSNDQPSYVIDEIRDERYDPERHFPDNILGRASFFKGFNKLSYYPGLFLKLGLNFEYSNESDLIKAIETGVTLDAFYKEVPMMAFNDNQQFFYSFYVNILYGKRKTAGEVKEKKSRRNQGKPQEMEIDQTIEDEQPEEETQ